MKAISFCFIFFIASSFLSAQIPNNSFENWTSGNPNDWSTTNIPSVLEAVTQSSDAHTGSSAARMEVLLFNNDVYPPYLTTSFPVSQQYGSLTGYYKFSPVNGNNTLLISIVLSTSSSVIGAGSFETSAAASSYTQFTAPIQYGSSDVPSSALIQIIVSDTSENQRVPGSVALVDELNLGGAVDVGDENSAPLKYELNQNYPNPFNPETKIKYSVAEKSFVQMKVYDIVGNEVAVLVNSEKTAGNYSVNFDGSRLPSGIYIVQMKAGNFTKSLKMTLMK